MRNTALGSRRSRQLDDCPVRDVRVLRDHDDPVPDVEPRPGPLHHSLRVGDHTPVADRRVLVDDRVRDTRVLAYARELRPLHRAAMPGLFPTEIVRAYEDRAIDAAAAVDKRADSDHRIGDLAVDDDAAFADQ